MSPRADKPITATADKIETSALVRFDDTSYLAKALAFLDLHIHDRLMEAVADAAKELLRSVDLTVSLPKVAEQVGRATGVDRAHIILIDGNDGDGQIKRHYLWSGMPDQATPPEFRHATAPMAQIGLKSWIPKLKRGETIAGDVCDFEPDVRAFFEHGNVKSTLCVPVSADNRWLGIIGFDDCRGGRKWTAAEIGAIKIVAELVGAAIGRAAHLQELADAKRIIDHSTTILFRFGPKPPFPLTFISQNISLYGYQAEELLADPERWAGLIDGDDFAAVLGNIASISDGSSHEIRHEFRLRKPDGSISWFDGYGTAVRNSANKLIAIEGIVTDITKRKITETELSFSNVLLTTAIESSPDAILVVDTNNHIIKYNQNFIDLWRVSKEDLENAADGIVREQVASQIKDGNKFLERVSYLYEHPVLSSHEEIETKDERIIDRHSDALYGPNDQYLGRVWFFRDITEKRRADDKMEELARTDALTGLANRSAFLERLSLEFARAKRGTNRFALHYLDLDHFKDVNDTLGHPVGDKLLQAVAKRLRSCVRDIDMVARFGGDEFALIQDDISDTASVEALANKIATVIAAPYLIEDSQIQTTASIGIVPYSGDIAGVDAMMMKADLALYRAKNEGRNQFRFHELELDEQTREKMIIGEELRHAVKRGEFELYYQPQVDLKSGRIVGMEALIRWNHPHRGLMAPAAFIPIAETTGSIVPIGEWVIENACKQIKAWNVLGIAPLTVAINLSGAQFKLTSQLDQIITDNLARYNIAPQQIELELTESVLLETTQRHGNAFNRLRKIGVRLAIDDFGTGYSSLDYLRSFRVSRLKIDPSFVADVATSADAAAIVRATIGLAHALGIDVVAEGVETMAQRDFLISASCKFAQGYFFGKPMPAAAAGEKLRQNLQVVAA